jgi:hypothetical protein
MNPLRACPECSEGVTSILIPDKIYLAMTQYSGQMRVRAVLIDGGLLEVFEYVTVNPGGMLVINKDRYHWQDAAGNLVRRWDTAAHHLHLPHAPHHVHLSDGSVEGVAKPPDIAAVITQIETHLRAGGLL